MHSLPNGRTAAATLGEEFFFTGKPCKRGHLAPRKTVTGDCVECRKIRNAAGNKRIIDLMRAASGEAA